MTIESVLQQTNASKLANLNLSLIAEEQKQDPVLKIVRTWVDHKNKPTKNHELRESRVYQSYFNHFEALFIDRHLHLVFH